MFRLLLDLFVVGGMGCAAAASNRKTHETLHRTAGPWAGTLADMVRQGALQPEHGRHKGIGQTGCEIRSSALSTEHKKLQHMQTWNPVPSVRLSGIMWPAFFRLGCDENVVHVRWPA